MCVAKADKAGALGVFGESALETDLAQLIGLSPGRTHDVLPFPGVDQAFSPSIDLRQLDS
jgi:hypothetical protein